MIGPDSGPAGGVSFDDVIDRTLRRLGSTPRINSLATELDLGTTAFSFGHTLTHVDVGTILQIGTELMYVWDLNTSDPAVVTVERAFGGSGLGIHGIGAQVTINPVYPRFDVAWAINDELASLVGHGLFQYRATEFTWNPALVGYEISDPAILEGLDLSWEMPTGFREWPRLTTDAWRLEQNADPDAFPSGKALFIKEGGYPGKPMRFIYRATFSSLVNGVDDVQQVSGLHAEAADILSLGAAIRMIDPVEVERNNYRTQGDTRRPSEVPPGAAMRSTTAMMNQRERRIGEERTRLRKFYPQRRPGW